MIYICIDTCDWTNLGKELPKLLETIFDLINEKKIKLILPKLVRTEWERHKLGKIVVFNQESLITKTKHAREVMKLLNLEDVLEMLDGKPFQSLIQANSEKEVQSIDSLFSSDHVTWIEASTENKLQAVELAIEKKAPFHHKNSMADALIVLSFLEFVENKGITGAYFISGNKDDFSESNGKDIHTDLEGFFAVQDTCYFSNIGLAINHIKTGLVTAEELEIVDEVNDRESNRRSITLDNLLMEREGFRSAISAISNQEFLNQANRSVNNAAQAIVKFPQQQLALFASDLIKTSQERLALAMSDIIKTNQEQFARAIASAVQSRFEVDSDDVEGEKEEND